MNRPAILLLAPLAAALLTAAAPAKRKAAPPPPRPPVALPMGDTVRVAIVTEMGTIEADLDHLRAPKTVENFVRYVDGKRFDGMTFYRAMHLDWGDQPNGLIQGGWSGDPRKVLPPVIHEPTSLTGISHKAGALSMARFAPGTATSDFSILLADLPQLDADPKSADPDLQAGFSAFGHVVSGMDVVRRIWDAPRSPTKGEGTPLKGQLLEPAVKVLSVRRVVLPAAAPLSPPAPVSPPPAAP
ncbi:peptidylprolyl isomerase [Novosphingobium flavum]|uniref:peptidylprolyl isomerase n=1 Tax=Novosphingobium flavum TaxID=1778672 RepID=A0A7X1FTY8_9SPHN|nr:peptidylprolyl isomerase [Novosphingobium flavum]MBC2666906.1 peptidylprolyl isomerase [Novosphingobium flavum]